MDGARNCSAASVEVNWMGNDQRPAPGKAKGALGLPMAPRGDWYGCGGAPWPRDRRGGIEGPLEGPKNGKVGMLEGVWWCWRQ